MNCGGHALLYLPSSNHISGIFSSSEICLFLPLFCLHDEKFCVMNNMTRNPGHNWSVQKLVPYSSWANWKGPQGMWTLRCHLGLVVLLNWGDATHRLFSAAFFFLFLFSRLRNSCNWFEAREKREAHMKRDPKRMRCGFSGGWGVRFHSQVLWDTLLKYPNYKFPF